MKVKRGDTVQIISGRDRGKSGKVMKVNVADSTILLEGLNLVKKHLRPKRQGEKGQVLSLPRPLNISKIMLLCPNCKKAVRAGYRLEGESKVRYCRKCKGII